MLFFFLEPSIIHKTCMTTCMIPRQLWWKLRSLETNLHCKHTMQILFAMLGVCGHSGWLPPGPPHTHKHTHYSTLHPLAACPPGESAHLLTSSNRGVKVNLTQGSHIPSR